MIIKNLKKFILTNRTLIVIFFALLLLSSLFPYSSDDWAWGSKYGIEQLKSLFQEMNGRYLGNILVIILTRYKIIKIIVVAVTILLISIFISNIINKKKYIYLSLLLFFLMPIKIFSTTIVWASGFANYGFTALFLLYFIYVNRNINAKEEVVTKLKLIFLFILSLISGLFMENLTIYFLITSLLLSIYYYYKYKKLSINNLFYFVGSLISTIIMFSNQTYIDVITGTDYYRDVSNNLFVDMIVNYFRVISRNAIQYNMFLNIIILLLFSVLVYNSINKNNEIKGNYNKNLRLLITIMFSYVLYNLLRLIDVDFKPFLKFTVLFDGIFTFFFFIALLILPLITIKEKQIRERLFFYWFSIVILIGPLFFVSPISSRNFLLSYILLILFVLEIANYLIIKYSININYRIILLIGVMLTFYYLSIFAPIYYWDKIRTNHVESENKLGKKIIEVPKLPNGHALLCPDPDIDDANIMYKWFNKIDENVEIKVLPQNEWKKRRN